MNNWNPTDHPRGAGARFVDKANSPAETSLPSPRASMRAHALIPGDTLYTNTGSHLGTVRNVVPDGYDGVDVFFDDGSAFYGATRDDMFQVESALLSA